MNQNKHIVIVTGGSGLLGRDIVNYLLSKAYIVCNFDIVNFECHQEDYHYYQVELTQEESVTSAVQDVIKERGDLHGLVNNAYPRTKDWGLPFEKIPLSSWRQNVDMQLNSVFVITQQVINHLQMKSFGSIVNIASIYGVVGNDLSLYEKTNVSPPAAYSAIKGGLINFTRYLASKFGKYQIRINCVSPGGIFDHQDRQFVRKYESRVPMKRMGQPDDIAPVVEFLLSQSSKYITGQNIIVDGGWTII